MCRDGFAPRQSRRITKLLWGASIADRRRYLARIPRGANTNSYGSAYARQTLSTKDEKRNDEKSSQLVTYSSHRTEEKCECDSGRLFLQGLSAVVVSGLVQSTTYDLRGIFVELLLEVCYAERHGEKVDCVASPCEPSAGGARGYVSGCAMMQDSGHRG